MGLDESRWVTIVRSLRQHFEHCQVCSPGWCREGWCREADLYGPLCNYAQQLLGKLFRT